MQDREQVQEEVRAPGIGGADKAEGMPGGEQAGGSYREKAKHVLYREIAEAETQCKLAGFRKIKLQALYDSLPEVLPQEADEALWGLLMAARRKQ